MEMSTVATVTRSDGNPAKYMFLIFHIVADSSSATMSKIT